VRVRTWATMSEADLERRLRRVAARDDVRAGLRTWRDGEEGWNAAFVVLHPTQVPDVVPGTLVRGCTSRRGALELLAAHVAS
jgi:hypothetical protein